MYIINYTDEHGVDITTEIDNGWFMKALNTARDLAECFNMKDVTLTRVRDAYKPALLYANKENTPLCERYIDIEAADETGMTNA